MIRLVHRSYCMRCDWTDDSPKTDLEARKHVDATKHPVITEAEPEGDARPPAARPVPQERQPL